MTPQPYLIDSWRAAELNAAVWMRAWGWSDAAVTPTGADGGIDVRATGALAQVKWEAKQVGRAALQKLVGARGLDHELALMFFSGAGYSRDAIAYADLIGIGLFKYRLDGSTEAVNDAARQICVEVDTSPLPVSGVQPNTNTTADAPQSGFGSAVEHWVTLPDRHQVVSLDEALSANPSWSEADREQVRDALDATKTVTYTLREPKRDCIFGWDAEGRKTVDVTGRTVYFKEVSDVDIPGLPPGTHRSPKTGWIILRLT